MPKTPQSEELFLELYGLLMKLSALVHQGYQAVSPPKRPSILRLSNSLKVWRQKLLDALEYFRINHKTFSGLYELDEKYLLDPIALEQHINMQAPEIFGAMLLATDQLEEISEAQQRQGVDHILGLCRMLHMMSPIVIDIWGVPKK